MTPVIHEQLTYYQNEPTRFYWFIFLFVYFNFPGIFNFRSKNQAINAKND